MSMRVDTERIVLLSAALNDASMGAARGECPITLLEAGPAPAGGLRRAVSLRFVPSRARRQTVARQTGGRRFRLYSRNIRERPPQQGRGTENPVMLRGKIAALAILFCLAACAGKKDTAGPQPGASAPVAAEPNTPVMNSSPAPSGPTPYYVEFRARLSTEDVFGHTYLVYGPQDGSGRALEEHAAGFYPLVGPLGILIGTVAFPGEVGDGFVQDYMPLLDAYRVNITAAHYDQLTRFVAEQKAHPRLYSLLAHDCNDWAAEAATVVGLRAPPFHVLPPGVFIMELRAANN
jgi:hypothetical protein